MLINLLPGRLPAAVSGFSVSSHDSKTVIVLKEQVEHYAGTTTIFADGALHHLIRGTTVNGELQ